ncbi:MAG: manganese efflux pump, partial [Rikenellaceae bacterium]
SCSTLRSAIMFGLALSIDAIIAGFSLGMTKIDIVNLSQLTNILIVSAIIGLSAFLITLLGINIGGMVGKKLGGKAEIFGGLVLIILGLKTLLTHILI